MTQLQVSENPTAWEVHEIRKVEAGAPPGWRCVWLPQHGVFLAFLDAETATPGMACPSVAEASADAVLAAIASLEELAVSVRQWLALTHRAAS